MNLATASRTARTASRRLSTSITACSCSQAPKLRSMGFDL
jgi:hypothetical protein